MDEKLSMFMEIYSLPWRCIQCGARMTLENNALRCGVCQNSYASKNDCVMALPHEAQGLLQTQKSFDNALRGFFKRWPTLYYGIATFFGPAMFTGLSAKKFIAAYHKSSQGIGLNLGSGPKFLDSDVVNLDLFAFPNVQVCASVLDVPLVDECANSVVADEVIEHVDQPQQLLSEMHRLLKPGGYAYITVPFLYPYHAAPVDRARFTRSGFANLAKDFEVVESGVWVGPFSALNVLLCYLTALVLSFGSEKLFWIIMNVSIVIFFPVKLLDLVFARLKTAEHLASVYYFVLKKN